MSNDGQMRTIPSVVWVINGVLALAGAYLVIESLRGLPDTFDLFGVPGLSKAFALVILMLLATVAAMGVALLLLARMLHRGDRVGRGLAYVVCATVASSLLMSDQQTTGMTLAALGALAAAAALALVPEVEDFFRASHLDDERPYGIVVAQTLVMVWVIALGWVALLYVLLAIAGAGGKWAAIGLLLAAITVAGQRASAALSRRDIQARLIITCGLALTIILVLAGKMDTGFIAPLGLSAGALAFLWMPEESRAYFTPQPAAAAIPPPPPVAEPEVMPNPLG